MFLIRAIWCVVMGVVLCSNASARLLLINSQDSLPYREFQQGVAVLASKASQTIDVRLPEEISKITDLSGYDAVIVAGVDAAKVLAAIGSVKQPVIYTMLPLASYQWLADNKMLIAQHKVIYIDQPPQRYVHMARAAVPDIRSIGYLYGNTSVLYLDEVKRAVTAAKLEFVEGDLSSDLKLSTLLKEMFSGSDVVLTLPDPLLYNRRVVQEVLLASFRNKRPLLVYSESFVKAGAMVALISTPGQIGEQTGEYLSCLLQPCYGEIPMRAYPKYFSVIVNESVARQFGIESKSGDELRRYIESVESGRLK